MRISYISNNVSFGYDRKLNAELKAKLKEYPDKEWASTLSGMNSQCNKLEENVKREYQNQNSPGSKYHDYLDMFLSYKQMLAGFVSMTFEDLKFADREYKHYQDSFIKEGSKEDAWQRDVCDYLTEWTEETPASPKTNKQEVKIAYDYDDEDDEQLAVSGGKQGKSNLELFVPTAESPQGLDDVTGLSDLKRDLKEDIIDYLKNPIQAKLDFQEYGITIPKGILLYGPPGCGKTYITQAISAETKIPLYMLNLSNTGSGYINMTSKNISLAFNQAINTAKITGKPCLVFMDELDTLGFNRTSDTDNEDLKQVGTMLQAIDNAQQHNVILIGATNKYNLLDPAIVRRFESPYFVDLPDKAARKELLIKTLSKFSKGQNLVNNDDSIDKLSELLNGYSNKSICIITKNAAKIARRRNRADISVEDYIQSIKVSNQEKPDRREYLPDSAVQATIGFIS